MKSSSKLLEKHHQYLKNMNKEAVETQTQPQSTIATTNQNPFARPVSTQNLSQNSMITSNLNPQQGTKSSVQEIDIERLKAYNSNSDYIRLTTEVFPQIANSNSVVFPLGAFIKPFGLSVN